MNTQQYMPIQHKNVKYWVIHHDADLTETGCSMCRTYVKSNWVGFPAQRTLEQEILEDFCYKRFGNKVAYVQGVAATLSWRVDEIVKEVYDKANPVRWGGYNTKTMKLELDIGNRGQTVVKSEQEIFSGSTK
jgi:hypothetical protein